MPIELFALALSVEETWYINGRRFDEVKHTLAIEISSRQLNLHAPVPTQFSKEPHYLSGSIACDEKRRFLTCHGAIV